MTRFLLIRHATNDTVGKRLTGRSAGVHLNEEGKTQAQHLAGGLTGLPLAAVYSSPLERAVETAAPIAASHNIQAIVSDDFLEIEFGEWTGRSFEELNEQPAFQLFNTFRSCTHIPTGEFMLEAQLRIINALNTLRTRHQNETVAIVSHADLIKAAIAYYAGIHLDMFQRLEISPASVSIVELYQETVRVVLVNHTGEIRF
jgi:probable phosphomutase (TIGR03848 family)